MGRDATQLLDEAESKVFDIAEQGARGKQGFQDMPPLLTQVVERIDMLYNRDNPNDVTGVPTGFVDLDRMTSGLQAGDLVIVAGRPSMGKTSLAMNIAEHVALDTGLPVGIFSMEMASTQLVMRMLGSVGKLDQHELRTGRLQDQDWQRLTEAVGKLNDAPMHIDETAALNPLELRARARRLHRQYKQLGLIVVDYLQLMSASSEGENRATELSEISRSMKALAKELGCPVIALSQLNRSLEQRPNKRPVMSDLRESGAIEQDADLILFIYRDEVYNPETRGQGHRRDHHRQAAQRADRHRAAGVPRRVHPVREPRRSDTLLVSMNAKARRREGVAKMFVACGGQGRATVGMLMAITLLAIGQAVAQPAAKFAKLTPEQVQTLLALAHDYHPRDGVGESNYATCIAPYDAQAGNAQDKQSMDDAMALVEGSGATDGATRATRPSTDDYERMRLATMLAEKGWMKQFRIDVGQCLDRASRPR